MNVRPRHRWHMRVLSDASATHDRLRVPETRTHLSDDLPLHKQSHRCVQAVCVPLHVKLEIVLRLLPLSNASATPIATSKVDYDTFSSRCWRALSTLCSDASVRGPYRRVSCTPCALAVDVRSAFGAPVAGVSLYWPED